MDDENYADFSEEEGGTYSSDEDEPPGGTFLDQHGKLDVKNLSKFKKLKSIRSPLTTEVKSLDQEEEDDFEKEMRNEFENRAKTAEESILGTSWKSEPAPAESKEYDRAYFDSDEDDEDFDRNSKLRSIKSNDDLMYDPKSDEDNQAWINELRNTYRSKKPGESPDAKPLPNSDAVLNCPACFSVLCLDCQKHELYSDQFRAMFVLNCTVDSSTLLKFPTKAKKKGRRGASEEESNSESSEYHPVKCDTCSTQVAVYDKDEVYHFFNVVSSRS